MSPFLLRRLCLSLASLGLWAQGPFELARPALRIHGMEDGLPSATIYTFAKDTKGRLWAGTVDGAACYTGHGWVPLRLPRESNSQYVRSILASQDGSLWFATQDGGLWRYEEGNWSHHRGGQELPSDHVFSLAETRDAQGRLVRWVGTAGDGIARLAEGRWQSWGPTSGGPSSTVWRIREIQEPDGRRRIWAATEKGLWVFEQERWRPMGPAEGFPPGDSNDILDVLEPDGTRSVWVSLWDRGLARWDRKGWRTFASGGEFPPRFPSSSLSVTYDPQGRPILWVGTLNQGLWWYRDGKWHSLGRNQGFQTVGVLSLMAMPEGKPTLLMGTRGGGVASLDLGGWRTLDESHGLPGMEVTCFGETREAGQSVFWIGTTAGLTRYKGEGGCERVHDPAFPSDYIISLLPTQDTLWVATLNGLVRKDATGWHRIEGPDTPSSMVIALLETHSRTGTRTLWVGTPRGLFRLREGRWQRLTTKDGLPQDFVSSLWAVPGAGEEPDLWIGTRGGGVCRLAGGTWTPFGANAGIPNGNIYALHPSTGHDGKRWLWAGTLGGGLARLDLQNPGRWEVFTRENLPGLPSNYIQRIETDAQGRLYLSTSSGVVRLQLDWKAGAPQPARVDTFTLGDGLPSPNGNLGASFLDSRGRIWIGTSRGAAILDPAIETFAATPPQPVLERVTVADPERHVAPGQRLGYRDAHLRFEFSLPAFHRMEDTRYQTQLLGLESEPRPWHKEAWREFATLPPGRYTLRVWGRTFDGRVSGPVEFPFQVAPAPWAHPLAYGLYILGAAAAILGYLRLRTRALRARTAALKEAVRERTLIIEQQAQELEASNQELQGRNAELSTALAEVKTLQGLIPICSYCKKIRDDGGLWDQMEHYISQHSGAQFSHGICPDCRERVLREAFGADGGPKS